MVSFHPCCAGRVTGPLHSPHLRVYLTTLVLNSALYGSCCLENQFKTSASEIVSFSRFTRFGRRELLGFNEPRANYQQSHFFYTVQNRRLLSSVHNLIFQYIYF